MGFLNALLLAVVHRNALPQAGKRAKIADATWREGTEHGRFALLIDSRRNRPPSFWRPPKMPGNLIYYALVLIVIALLAAFFGFGGVAATAISGAHLLIWVAVIVVVIGVVFALVRRA
jgi:uncharacterized membrane protein YtjA (UPF0391 family)